MKQDYDIIIIGSGAGGGTLAHALSNTGKRILLIERGDYLPREKENWQPNAVFVKNRYHGKEKWLDGHGKPFVAGMNYYVGGNTKVYGAALLRLRERDFQEVRHYGGISPAWPLDYETFKPYYLKAEQLYTVHGERGQDPTEPPEDAPYPYPPVSHEPFIARIAEHLRDKQLKPFHLPMGIQLDEKDKRHSKCIRCDTCDGYPCLVDAKSDAQICCVDPALKSTHIALLTNSKVLRLILDEKRRSVKEVEVDHQGRIEHFRAPLVIVACGAINSAALLLRSRHPHHPEGIANSSGLVGRHYMFHNNSVVVAVSTVRNPTAFQKTLAINDFYFNAPDSQLPLGHIQLLGKVKKDMLAADAPFFAPGMALEYVADHCVGWWLTSEDLPDPENRVTVTSEGQIQLFYTPNNQEAHRRLLKTFKGILSSMEHHVFHFPNRVYLTQQVPLAGCAHQTGTCRFGSDPKNSVLDLNCKAHDIDNLYVVDGSFFPSIAAVNPTLTIIANALRVADHLKSEMGVK